MSRQQIVLTAAAVLVVAAAAFTAGRYGAPGSPGAGSSTPSVASAVSAASGASPASAARRILYWHDPMVPGPRFDKPGKSPFMDMALQPVYADEAGDSGVRVSPAVQQSLGVRVVAVRRESVASDFDAVGTVQFDERRVVAVQTRVNGYVEQLAVRAPMERVRQGQALATVFAPDWLGPLGELLALEHSGASGDLIEAARARLRALSVPDALVRRSEEAGTAQARFTLAAPSAGVVAELGVREGAAVSPGMTLFRLAGLDKVWAVAEVPESQLARLVPGQAVRATLQADPRLHIDGTLDEILPQVNPGTRTLQARFVVANPGGRLTPGMLLHLQFAGPVREGLVVPAEAVIRTGTRSLVIVRRADGSFAPRDVQPGADLGDRLEIAGGLSEGEQVVASGQFLIDSEANLRAATANLGEPGATPPAPATPASGPLAGGRPASTADAPAQGQGRVEHVDARTLTISHGPIASLHWPAMTMGFDKPAPDAFKDVRVGDTVRFRFRPADGGFVLVSVERVGEGR